MGISDGNMDWEFLRQWQTITIASAIVLVIQALAIFSALHSLRHVRTSQAAVAWTIALITLPFVALPLYWVFARHRFEGYREAIREVEERHQKSVRAVQQELMTDKYVRSTRQQSALELIADVLDTYISRADRTELLIDGEAFFDALFRAIERAEKYVYVAFYIIRADSVGDRVADALIARARAGVQIRLLYDEVGCLRLSGRYLSRLAEAGIDVRAFNTRQGWVNRFQINFRNHRKLVVVDGKSAIVGGLNVGDEYLGPSANMPAWRDTAIEVHGPVARKAQAVFAGDYYWAARQDLPEADWRAPEDEDEVEDADEDEVEVEDADKDEVEDADGHKEGNAAVCATGPADLRPRAPMMFAAAAAAAKSRLWISTPYLVPDESSQIALHMARARGVDVRLLIPREADHWGVYLAGFHYEQEFADAAIPVYRYQAGFMHQKCILIDNELAMIGSINLDNRSLYLNFELMIACDDRDFVAKVASMLDEDFANATHSNAPDAPTRWWFERAGTAVARLFSPVL